MAYRKWKMENSTQSAQQAQSKEHNTYIVESYRQSNVPIPLIITMALWRHDGYVMNCFNWCIYAPCLVLVEHSVGCNTNNASTRPQIVHSRHVATKPLWRWWGRTHWNVFMSPLYMYYAPYFVFVEHFVCHESIPVLINKLIYTHIHTYIYT